MENSRFDHPSADGGNRFPLDQAIRDRGYTLKDRPKNGEPPWQSGGVVFTQSEVIAMENISVTQ